MRKICFLIPFLFLGCVSSINPTFVQAIKEHKQDTLLVNNSLVATFEEEMANETRPEAIVAYEEIINNLNFISHQATILYKYLTKELSEEDFVTYLKYNWRKK